MLCKRAQLNIGELCNGSTTDSDSVCWGSNPYSPAKNKPPNRVVLFLAKKGNGIRTRQERSGRKQYGVLFSLPWATSVSEAIAYGSARKNPVKIFASPPIRVVLFLAKRGNGIRTMVFCVAEWMNPFPTQDNIDIS